jgi:hypothetical protein
VLPGFGLTLGYTMVYLCLLVLIPLSAVFVRSFGSGWLHFWEVVTSPRVLASLRLSFGASLFAASVNAVFGLLVAWVLVRHSFPFKRLVDALVDLPFALPTAVAGIALTALYAPNGWMGAWLKTLGISVAFTPAGIVVALTFIGLPFVVRTLQPVLEDLDREVSERTTGIHPRDSARALAGLADGICVGLRARRRGIRLGHFHCRQHADEIGNRSAAHRHETGAVRLCRRVRHRSGHAGAVLRPDVGHQCVAKLGYHPPR